MDRERSKSPAGALGALILVRLLDPGKSGQTLAKVARDLGDVLAGAPLASVAGAPRSGWHEVFRSAVDVLAASGQVVFTGKAGRERLRLTEAGIRSALAYLGVEALPAGTTWKDIRDVHLVAKALGCGGTPSPEVYRLKGIANLQGAILRQRFGLRTPECPKADEALRALLWRQLGMESGAPFTLKAVKEHLLNELIEGPRQLTLAQLKAVLPAQAVKARRSDASGLRLALLQGLAADGGPDEAPAIAPPCHEDQASAADAAGLASEILEAARRSPTGWYGSEKVFISHAWRSHHALHPERHMGLAAFKERLADLNRRGLVALSRADLVEAMDKEDVPESETSYLNARFHFLRIPGGPA